MGNEKNMEKKFIEKIQKRVVNLLLTLSDNLPVAANNQCSEITRLVGCWIIENHPEYKARILKGKLSDDLSHDVLVVDDRKTLFLIDPTIWQIFPESGSVFIGSVRNIPEAIGLLRKKYGGMWKMSEIMRKCDESYQQELLTVIKNNG